MGRGIRRLVQRRTPPRRHPLRHAERSACPSRQTDPRAPPRRVHDGEAVTPRRWSRHTRNWTPVGAVYLNPIKDEAHRAARVVPVRTTILIHTACGGVLPNAKARKRLTRQLVRRRIDVIYQFTAKGAERSR